MKRKLLESALVDPSLVSFVVAARNEVTRAQGIFQVTAADIFT
jgi:hypothetical protein